jgi:hypothetical protein
LQAHGLCLIDSLTMLTLKAFLGLLNNVSLCIPLTTWYGHNCALLRPRNFSETGFSGRWVETQPSHSLCMNPLELFLWRHASAADTAEQLPQRYRPSPSPQTSQALSVRRLCGILSISCNPSNKCYLLPLDGSCIVASLLQQR